MYRYFPLPVVLFLAAIFLVSCRKDGIDGLGTSRFYGQWKSDYGDTLVFTRENGQDVLRYRMSLNPAAGTTTTRQYHYKNGRLGLQFLGGSSGVQWLQTFAWTDENRAFQVLGAEWFPFLSSTVTVFSFERLP